MVKCRQKRVRKVFCLQLNRRNKKIIDFYRKEFHMPDFIDKQNVLQILEENGGTAAQLSLIRDLLPVRLYWDGYAFQKKEELRNAVLATFSFYAQDKRKPAKTISLFLEFDDEQYSRYLQMGDPEQKSNSSKIPYFNMPCVQLKPLWASKNTKAIIMFIHFSIIYRRLNSSSKVPKLLSVLPQKPSL